MQNRIIAPRMNRNPRTLPMEMPAIAPADRPSSLSSSSLVAGVASAVGVAVPLGKSGATGVVIGSSTPSHRLSTSAPMQQESVEFGELEAQNEQRPARFDR